MQYKGKLLCEGQNARPWFGGFTVYNGTPKYEIRTPLVHWTLPFGPNAIQTCIISPLKSGHLLYTGHFIWSQCNTNMYYFTPEIRTPLVHWTLPFGPNAIQTCIISPLKSGHLLYTGHFIWSQCNTNMYHFTTEIRTPL